MIRVKTYDNEFRRIQAPGVQTGNALPAVRNAADTAAARTLASMLDSGDRLTQLAAREYVADETARVSQSLQLLNADLAAERERYMRENRGESAVDAGAHFEKYAAERAWKYMQDGKFQGRFAEEFEKQAMGSVLHFTEQGRSYGKAQREAWNASVFEGAISDFRNQVSQNYDNDEWLEYSFGNLETMVNAMRPGLDNTAVLNDVRKDAAIGVIDGYLNHDDIAGASRAVERFAPVLGERADSVKDRIRNRSENLRARREAEAARLESDLQKQAVEDAGRRVLAELDEVPEDWTWEQRTARMITLTESMENREQRNAVRFLVEAELKEREFSRSAAVMEELGVLERTFRANPNLSFADRLGMIRTGNFQPETKKRAEKDIRNQMEGHVNEPTSMLGARRICSLIDRSGGTMDSRQVSKLMLDFGLNSRDRQRVLAYMSGRPGLQSRTDAVIDSVFGRQTPEVMRAQIFSGLQNDPDVRSGRELDDKELKSKVAALKAGMDFGSMPSFADVSGRSAEELLRPDLSPELSSMLSQELEAQYPAYRSAPEDTRELMRQALYLKKYLGLNVAFTEEEKRRLRGM